MRPPFFVRRAAGVVTVPSLPSGVGPQHRHRLGSRRFVRSRTGLSRDNAAVIGEPPLARLLRSIPNPWPLRRKIAVRPSHKHILAVRPTAFPDRTGYTPPSVARARGRSRSWPNVFQKSSRGSTHLLARLRTVPPPVVHQRRI